MNFHQLESYEAPKFMVGLHGIPKKRVRVCSVHRNCFQKNSGVHLPQNADWMAMLPTPIHKWKIPGAPKDFEIFIKRDDMTGCALSGNKVRKLEFLLADAMSRGCRSVITCGGVQSNHCRATAVTAKELGMDCHLLLRSENTNIEKLSSPGNLLPSILCGSHIYLIPLNSRFDVEVKQRQEILADKILKSTGHPSYCIPLGGSNEIGVFGFIEAWNEMMSQHVDDIIDDIVVACGSGGTIAGLAIGNFLTGSKIRLHAICVNRDKHFFHQHINEMLAAVGITQTTSEELVNIIDGHKGDGYGKSTVEDHEFLHELTSSSGVICDPVYTGKAARGMLKEMQNNPGCFKGRRIMFIHTGGIFGVYDGTMQHTMNKTFQNLAHSWPILNSPPTD